MFFIQKAKSNPFTRKHEVLVNQGAPHSWSYCNFMSHKIRVSFQAPKPWLIYYYALWTHTYKFTFVRRWMCEMSNREILIKECWKSKSLGAWKRTLVSVFFFLSNFLKCQLLWKYFQRTLAPKWVGPEASRRQNEYWLPKHCRFYCWCFIKWIYISHAIYK